MPRKNSFFIDWIFSKKIARFFYAKFLKPNSKDEGLSRKEFILNVILVSSISLCGFFGLLSLHSIFFEKNYTGIGISVLLLIFIFFVILYVFSRFGFFLFSSYLLTGILFLIVSFTAMRWGIELPQVLIMYALIIVMGGILVGSFFSFLLTFIISGVVIFGTYLQLSGITNPNLSWKPDPLKMDDPIGFAVTFSVIAIISWLSNREIEASLKRAMKSEAELKIERDMLEIRVVDRTRELEKLQAEKFSESARFIEFGKLSSGLFHDLTNHISFLFLNIDKAASYPEKELGEAREYLKQLQDVKVGLDNYLHAVKRQFQKQNQDLEFSFQKEIDNVLEVLRYRAKLLNVNLEVKSEREIFYFGNAIKFNHIISNLAVNSLDAYEESPKIKKRKIEIELKVINGVVEIIFRDWAGGIEKSILSEIFVPFFSTKKAKNGTGIGLSIVSDVLRADFDGTIEVESQQKKGTKFLIKFPLLYAKK